MKISNLTPEFAVACQILPEEIPAIARAGFKSIICNRPDGEEPGQPDFQRLEQAAREAGLSARYLPAVAGEINAQHGGAMAKLLDELPTPVLAYCRSGARSNLLWQLAQDARGSSRTE